MFLPFTLPVPNTTYVPDYYTPRCYQSIYNGLAEELHARGLPRARSPAPRNLSRMNSSCFDEHGMSCIASALILAPRQATLAVF